MKIFKKFLLIVAPIFIGHSSFSQSSPLPRSIILNDTSDYRKYEKDVLACISWIEKQPLNSSAKEVKDVNAFLITWMIGTPSVSIALNGYVSPLTKVNSGMLLLYMCGWTKFVLENPAEKDEMKMNMAAVEEMLKVYKGMNGIRKDKKIDKLIAMQENNQLEDWVSAQLAKAKK